MGPCFRRDDSAFTIPPSLRAKRSNPASFTTTRKLRARRRALPLAKVLPEKLRCPAPGQLSGLAVVDGGALLVHEGMVGVVAEDFHRLAGVFHRLLEGIDRRRRAPIVLVGEMPLQWDFH